MIIRPFEPGKRVYGGCDLGSTTDLTVWAMIQPADNQGWICNWRFWLPSDVIEKAERRDNVPYRQWEQDGFLELTPGGRINHAVIKAAIVEDCLEHDISQVAVDPWNAEWLVAQIDGEGIEAVPVRQGYASLSEPSKLFEASVAEGTFKHGNNPVAAWMAENVEVEADVSGNIRPVKGKHSQNKRIDGILAAIMAIAVASVSTDDGSSPYDTPGNLML